MLRTVRSLILNLIAPNSIKHHVGTNVILSTEVLVLLRVATKEMGVGAPTRWKGLE